MLLTNEHIEKGSMTVTPDQAPQAAAEVNQYNELAERNHLIYKRRVREFEDYYGFINLGMTAILATGGRYHRYPMPILQFTAVSYAMIFIHVIAVILLAILKKELFKSACISCVLAVASWVYVPLIIVNFAAALVHDHTDEALKNQPGYPHFHTVRLHVEEQYDRPVPVQADTEQTLPEQLAPMAAVEKLPEEKQTTEEMEELI